MNTYLGIDPGNTLTAYAVIDGDTRAPLQFGKVPNAAMRDLLRTGADVVGIEMVASYGMAVGAEVFETCVAIGRYQEICPEAELVYRRDVKLHHCHSSKAKDANIVQALVDRFASGEPNYGKGTKAAPGWFYGFKADVWQAYALAVYLADHEGVTL